MSILRSVLAAFEDARGPLSLADLSRELGIETGALEGMLDFWLRKGRLRIVGPGASPDSCDMKHCAHCAASETCAVMFATPRRYVLADHEN